MKKATKTTRKKKENLEWESQTVPYKMLDDLCCKQQKYIEHRDTFMDRLKETQDRTLRHNYRLQERVKQLEEQNKTQEDNFVVVARECILMWQEMEKCGSHEKFLREKITTNIDQLEADLRIKH